MKNIAQILRKVSGLIAALAFGAAFYYATMQPYDAADKKAASYDGQFEFNGYLLYPEDMDTYNAYIGQSEKGRMSFLHPLYGESQRGAYVNVLWLALGKIKALFSLTFQQIFQIERFAAWLLIFTGTYLLLRKFLSDFKSLIWSVVVICASGAGWVVLASRPASPADLPQMSGALSALYHFLTTVAQALAPAMGVTAETAGPPDLYTEVSGFFQAAWVPHAAASVGLLLIAASFMFEWAKNPDKTRPLIFASAFAAVGSLIRPYEGLSFLGLCLFAVIPVIYLRKKAKLRFNTMFLLPILTTTLILGYYYYLFFVNPYWRVWGQGNLYPPPSFDQFRFAFFFGFYGTILLAVFALGSMLLAKFGKNKQASATTEESGLRPLFAFIIVAWVGWHIMLLYGGFLTFAWRTTAPLGLIGPVALALFIDAYVFGKALKFIKIKAVKFACYAAAILTVMAFSSPSNMHSIAERYEDVEEFNRYFFIEKSTVEAFKWAGENLPPKAKVLTHGYYSLKMPAYGDVRPILWHKDQTPDFKMRLDDYMRFNHASGDGDREAILAFYDVDFLFRGPLDEKFSSEYDFDNFPLVKKIYSNKLVSIYKIDKGAIKSKSLPTYFR